MESLAPTNGMVDNTNPATEGKAGHCLISPDMRFLQINETLASFHDMSADAHIGIPVGEIAPALEIALKDMMEQLKETSRASGVVEYNTNAGRGVEDERQWIATLSPVFDQHGEMLAASLATLDITERKALEQQRNQAFRDIQRQLVRQTALAKLCQEAIGDISLDDVMHKAVACAVEVLDVPLAKVLVFADSADQLKLVAGVGWHQGLVGHAGVGIDAESQAGYTLMCDEPVIVTDLETEERFSGPPLLWEHGVRSGVSVVIAGINSRPLGVFGIHTTELRGFEESEVSFLVSLATVITNAARKESASTQRTLLVREMAHRAGNMLQLVSSIAAQTFRGTTDLEVSRRAFNDRLASLARANHVIAQEGWQDTRFRQVVSETLYPFRTHVSVEGRDILLPPDLSFDLGLVLHELSTNSCKYGALAVDGAKVTVSWRIVSSTEPHQFQMEWIDLAAPRRTHSQGASKPSTGFGSKLIDLLISRKWQGSVKVDQSAGYRCEISVPLNPQHSFEQST